jgi:hypothetical protein
VKRVLACAVAALALAACAREARADGIVENWLRSLNQGAAGAPDRYAPDAVSEQVLPGWHDLDPGQLDTIEVGTATTTDAGRDVAFRIVDIDGAETIGVAHLVAEGDSWSIASVDPAASTAPLERSQPDRLLPGWPLAVLIAVVLTLAAVGALTLVRRGAERTP